MWALTSARSQKHSRNKKKLNLIKTFWIKFNESKNVNEMSFTFKLNWIWLLLAKKIFKFHYDPASSQFTWTRAYYVQTIQKKKLNKTLIEAKFHNWVVEFVVIFEPWYDETRMKASFEAIQIILCACREVFKLRLNDFRSKLELFRMVQINILRFQ